MIDNDPTECPHCDTSGRCTYVCEMPEFAKAMSATSYRILAAHGDMFSCLSGDCPRFTECWRAQKPDHSPWQSYATPEPNGCEDFIAIKHVGQPIEHSKREQE